MTNSNPTSNAAAEAKCPKRPWVMMMFSDDESVDRDSVPPGLRFHLSRCPACSTLADQLASVTKSLSELADDQLSGNFADSVQAHVQDLLEHEPVLTGRVHISDEVLVAQDPMDRFRARLPWLVGGAIAACMALVLSGAWLFINSTKHNSATDSWAGQTPYDSTGAVQHYVWQEPPTDSMIEGPPEPAQPTLAEGIADKTPETTSAYIADSHGRPIANDAQGNSAKPSTLQRSLDNPQHAVSTKKPAKDR
jgi:hypothetical protein